MNGIFCLEGFWYGDHRDRTTVYPVLDMMNKIEELHQRMDTFHNQLLEVEDIVLQLNACKTQPAEAPISDVKKLQKKNRSC